MLLDDRNGMVATRKSSSSKPLDGEVMSEVPTQAQTVPVGANAGKGLSKTDN